MAISKRTFLLGATAAFAASSSIGAAAAAASASAEIHRAQHTRNRNLQQQKFQDVLSVCPDGTQCAGGERCYKTGRTNEALGIDEYKCGDCLDIGNNGGQCEYAADVYCVVGTGVSPDTGFCVNEGRCINNFSANPDRAECECSDDYEGPSCQLDKSSIPPSVNPPSPAPPPTNDRSIQLGLWPIVGISLAGLCVILLIIFFLTSGGRRVKSDEPSLASYSQDYPSSRQMGF